MFFEISYLKNGKQYKKVIEANTKTEAITKFKSLKLGVLRKIKEVNAPLSLKIEKYKHKFLDTIQTTSIDLEEYVAILEQMYVMLDASLSLNDVISNVSENVKNQKLKKILDTLLSDIQSGYNVSNSLKKFEKDIGQLSVAMIELGEQTGMLAESFRDLAEILSEILENRKKLKSATRYPVFILFAMSIAFTIVILFVIPPFKNIFAQLGADLPLPTKFLLWLEDFIRTFGPYILAIGIIAMIIINILYHKYEKTRLLLDKFMLKIYIVGSVIKFAMLGRFLYSFDKMVEAGIPIMDALDTALGVVDNLYLKTNLLKIKNAIAEGRGLGAGFAETNLFEKMIIQMIKSGENSGSLNRILAKASNYYRNKYLNIVENISTLIEPILIAAIAGFVVTLAFGIFLPMWGMAEAVKG